jgi:hypothetical protein
MSLVSDEEYTRVHSHVEFLVNPDTLVTHVREFEIHWDLEGCRSLFKCTLNNRPFKAF